MKKFLIKKQIISGRKTKLVASLTTKRQFRTTGCLLGKLIYIKCMIVPGHILDCSKRESQYSDYYGSIL